MAFKGFLPVSKCADKEMSDLPEYLSMKEPKRGPLRAAVRKMRLGTPAMIGTVRRHMAQHDTVIGVTGSVGKSTVTQLIGRILVADGPAYVAHGINTPRGIRSSFRRSPIGARLWVQEISGHEPASVAMSAAFVRPNIGVLTTIGDDHVKEFGSHEALAAGKGDLLAALPEEGVAVVNADDARVMEQSSRAPCRVISYGRAEDATVRVTSLDVGLPQPLRLVLRHMGEEATISAPFPAPRWAGHLAAAAAAGVAMGLPLQTVADRLSGAEPDLYKDSVHALQDGSLIVLDCFKASFWTLPSSFEVLQNATAPRTTFILGTLSDYRGSPRSRYSEAARGALEVADRVLAFGPHAYRLKRMLPDNPERLFLFDKFVDLAGFLDLTAVPGEILHVKASGIDHLERLMHRQREPILCEMDGCGISLRSCNSCKRLYGRKFSRSEALALR